MKLDLGKRRRALLAAQPATSREASPEALARGLEDAGPEFAEFLIDSGLGSLWHHRLAPSGHLVHGQPDVMDRLRRNRFANSALYAIQRSSLTRIDAVFAQSDVAYAVIKGAHVRELVYEDPALRPASDIDVLVAPSDRLTAARALIGAGFAMDADTANISHEATFSQGPAHIDLHWDILRPGRTRIGMAAPMLARRVKTKDFFTLQDDDAVFLMLVHPAFAKYVSSPHAALTSVADFLCWTATRDVDWASVSERLKSAGVTTSAWTVLSWWAMLIGKELPNVPPGFIARLRPGRMRSFYLRQWIARDLPSRWIDQGLLIQAGFTLFLHDRPSDAVRAVAGLARARVNADADPLVQLGRAHALSPAISP
jgi:hypothetical protein